MFRLYSIKFTLYKLNCLKLLLTLKHVEPIEKEGQEGEEEEDDPYDDADGDYDMDNADEMNAEADMAGELPSPNDD